MGITKCQIGDVTESCVELRAEQSVVDPARISHGRGNVSGTVPGHVVKVNRLDVVLVVITAQFERRVRSCLTDAIGCDMIKGSSQWVSRVFDLVRCNTGQEAGRTLGMRIGAVLECAIHPGDQ